MVEPLGSDTLVLAEIGGHQLQARLPPRSVRRAGDPLRLTVLPEHVYLFDPATERRM